MIFMHFTFQIALLAIGFGVGYWLLLVANGQEGTLKTVGQTLGWVLIIMSVFTSLVSSIASVSIADDGFMPCPMERMMQEHGMPTLDQTQNEKNEEINDQEESIGAEKLNDVETENSQKNNSNNTTQK